MVADEIISPARGRSVADRTYTGLNKKSATDSATIQLSTTLL
jgi:hypothetical protein